MELRLQIVAIAGAVGLLLFVLELVRRRALMERYALLWLFSSIVILVLAIWDEALGLLARQLGGSIAAADAAQFVQRARTDLAEARKLAPRFPDALAFSAINALWSQDLATAKRDLAVIDSLQLPADTPVLGYVDGMLRPALRAAEAASTSTTAPSGSSTTVPAGAVPSTTAAP